MTRREAEAVAKTVEGADCGDFGFDAAVDEMVAGLNAARLGFRFAAVAPEAGSRLARRVTATPTAETSGK